MSEESTGLKVTAIENIPVLPLRDVVVYPHMVIPLFVGREKSIQALDAAMRADKRIMLVAQKQADVDDPKVEIRFLHWIESPDGANFEEAIASDARRDLEKLFGSKVFLEVWVKVKGGWADDERALKSLGYE